MSFIRKLFGTPDAGRAGNTPATTAEAEHKGFVIRAAPRQENGQYLVAGSIVKLVNGELKQTDFIRADRSPNLDEITEMTLMKGRLMVDQQGEAMFG